MENIKAQYKAIFAILEANSNKKVSTILPQLQELMTSKQLSKNFRLDDDGNVTHVFCYYHKEWEDINERPYGKKANSATGLASMCKQGVSNWVKQQRVKKESESALLGKLADGTLNVKDLPAEQERIEAESQEIVPWN